jgi:hypothetical protein
MNQNRVKIPLAQFAFKAGLITAAIVLLLNGSQARADLQILAPIRVTPSETSVLLLPALDATKDSANMQAPRQLVVRHREQYEFITRHFKVLGDVMAAKAADAGQKIELGDSSGRTVENLEALAKRTGADWVVNIIVEEAKLDSSAGNEFTVHTSVLLQIWDARRHGWLADGSYTGQASDSGSPIFVFKKSLDDTTKNSLGNLLSVYPQVVLVSEENSLKDYLAGQTEPFTGDQKNSFSGLKTEK